MQTPDTSESQDADRPAKWCSRVDKHCAAFAVRVLFGFALAAFCAFGLIFQMVYNDHYRTEFVAMYFSLLSFAAGYFLGATPSLKRPVKKISRMLQHNSDNTDVEMGLTPQRRHDDL